MSVNKNCTFFDVNGDSGCSGSVKTNNDFCDLNIKLIRKRAVLKSEEFIICEYHEKFYLNKYSFFQKSCCDPDSVHKKQVTQKLQEITLELSEKAFDTLQFNLIPGKKLCCNCLNRLNEQIKTKEENLTPSQSSSEGFICTPVVKDSIEDCLKSLDLSPVKNVQENRKEKYLKRKLSDINEAAECALKKYLKTDFKSPDSPLTNKIVNKDEKFEKLMWELKDAYENSNHSKKVQLLTLFADNFTYQEIQDCFRAPKSQIKKAIQLKQEKGILSLPDLKAGSGLNDEVRNRVLAYYSDESLGCIRFLPGKRDCVSMSKGNYAQKRLILCTLKELYKKYKSENDSDKVGFSTFCSLRPKYAILAGASGTHSMCVCEKHQNVKLLLESCKFKGKYKDIIENIVCNINDSKCMLRVCPNCTNIEKLKVTIESNVFEMTDDIEYEQEISYYEWSQGTDRAQLLKKTSSLQDFIDNLVQSFNELIPHHYIAIKQSEFLKKEKENLDKETVIILLDFSENYSFVIQDEIQGNYWSRNSCTLHPVTIYSKSEDKVDCTSLCFLTDDLKHDVTAVHVFQNRLIAFIKENHSSVKKIIYFSDGCGAQYKNCQNFLNLCQHYSSHGIHAEWAFFATSHGKSPCDAIGGTIKRLAAKESLRRPYEGQILNVKDLFEYCQENIKNIQVFLIESDEIDSVRESTISNAQTLPGTRSYHHFIPLSSSIIGCKRISIEKDLDIRFDLLEKIVYNWKLNTYVSFVMGTEWYIGFINKLYEENLEADISILQEININKYKWPNFDIKLTVPYNNILCNVIVTEDKNNIMKVQIGRTKTNFDNFIKKVSKN